MNKLIYTVSSLNHYVKQMLDNDININAIMVKGEVSNFTNHRSGHWYFTLKDRSSKIACVMFASYACKCKILLKEGMQVIVHASLSMYEAQGSCQLFVTSVQVDGLGDLYLELEQTKEKMRKEGYFAEEHKQKLPVYPMNIGVISAKSGAAVQDILSTISRRWPIAKVSVYPTLVQGIQAAPAIITSLQQADEMAFDVILLARGGGAIEDLWCFNDETLAKVIYHMKTPVVTGVGHETDTTLVDYVSDARAPTPTAAAELITPDMKEVHNRMQQYQRKLSTVMKGWLEKQRRQLQAYQEHRYLKDPLLYIKQQRLQLAMHVKGLDQMLDTTARKRMQLDMIAKRFLAIGEKQQQRTYQLQRLETLLIENIEKQKTVKEQQLKEKALLLDAFSPLKILGRGYSITYKKQKIVYHTKDIAVHDDLAIQLQDGIVEVEVKDVKGTTI